jgi:hypothetical protein
LRWSTHGGTYTREEESGQRLSEVTSTGRCIPRARSRAHLRRIFFFGIGVRERGQSTTQKWGDTTTTPFFCLQSDGLSGGTAMSEETGGGGGAAPPGGRPQRDRPQVTRYARFFGRLTFFPRFSRAKKSSIARRRTPFQSARARDQSAHSAPLRAAGPMQSLPSLTRVSPRPIIARHVIRFEAGPAPPPSVLAAQHHADGPGSGEGAGRGVALPGCQIGYMDHTGGYMDHTGYHQLNRV